MNRLTDYYFWFSQPSTILDKADKNLLYLFLIILGLSFIFGLLARFVQNPVDKSLFRRLWHLGISTSLAGLLWFGMRYENTQIFGRRYWAGLTLVVAVVWLGFIFKYLIFNYRSQKSDYVKESIKNKYLPKVR